MTTAPERAGRPTHRVYLACNRDGGLGSVVVFERDAASGALVPTGQAAESPAPTFLALDPTGGYLYATTAGPHAGGVSGFRLSDEGGLHPIGVGPTGGEGTCHVAVHPSGQLVISAHYRSGHVVVQRLATDGAVGEVTASVVGDGHGPNPDRQEHSHAHFVWIVPGGESVVVVDLGTDQLRTYRLAKQTGALEDAGTSSAPPGSGPRHLRLHPDGYLLVTGELDSSLMKFSYGPVTGVGPCMAHVAASESADNAPSELALSHEGRFCYVANRGPDTVSVFSLEADTPRLVSEVPCGGSWPRHIAVIGEHLYVANQRSNEVTTFAIDESSGELRRSEAVIEIERPFCLLAQALAAAPA